MSKHYTCPTCSRPMKHVNTVHGTPKQQSLCFDTFDCRPCKSTTHVALDCTAKCNKAK